MLVEEIRLMLQNQFESFEKNITEKITANVKEIVEKDIKEIKTKVTEGQKF